MERFINRLDSSHSEEPIESIKKIGRENLEGALIPKQLHLKHFFFFYFESVQVATAKDF